MKHRGIGALNHRTLCCAHQTIGSRGARRILNETPVHDDSRMAQSYTMDMAPITDKKQWLAAYRATAEELERIAARDLAAMTDEEALRRIQLLGPCPTPWRDRPDWSGLVEQQALFHRRKKP